MQFTLVVDDFGVKYVGEEHVQHFKRTLKGNYTIITEWNQKRYIVITLDWDYKSDKSTYGCPATFKRH